MKLEIIEVKNIKNNQQWECDSVLLPTETGMKFVDIRSQKIITDTIIGTIKITCNNEIIPIQLLQPGIGYFNGQSLMILIK